MGSCHFRFACSFLLLVVSPCVAQDNQGIAPDGREGEQREMVPAMFVFGDSLVDNGNNNDLASLAKANYYPYGIDFSSGPTGRFSNGYTMVDEVGNYICFPSLFSCVCYWATLLPCDVAYSELLHGLISYFFLRTSYYNLIFPDGNFEHNLDSEILYLSF